MTRYKRIVAPVLSFRHPEFSERSKRLAEILHERLGEKATAQLLNYHIDYSKLGQQERAEVDVRLEPTKNREVFSVVREKDNTMYGFVVRRMMFDYIKQGVHDEVYAIAYERISKGKYKARINSYILDKLLYGTGLGLEILIEASEDELARFEKLRRMA